MWLDFYPDSIDTEELYQDEVLPSIDIAIHIVSESFFQKARQNFFQPKQIEPTAPDLRLWAGKGQVFMGGQNRRDGMG